MDDLISRKAAKAAIRSKFQSVAERCEINEVLNGLPAVDAGAVVRCQDCKHRPTDGRGEDDMTGFAITFPNGCCPCQCEDEWYNWYPHDSWFCANGERRDT